MAARKILSKKARKSLKKKKNLRKKGRGMSDSVREQMLRDGFALFHQNNPAAANQKLIALLSSPGDNPVLLNQLGVLAHMLGQSKTGLLFLRRSVELKQTAPLYNNLGLVMEQLALFDEAVPAYQKAIRLDPSFAPAHYNLGNVLQKQDRLDEAIGAYQKALNLQPDHAGAHTNLAAALMEQGNPEAAEKSCQQALRLDPDSSAAGKIWCEIMVRLAEPARILELCEERLAFLSRKDKILGNMADLFADMGHRNEALLAYRKALKHTVSGFGSMYLRMAMLKKISSTDPLPAEMEQALERAEKVEDKQHLCFALGKAYENLEQYDRAFNFIIRGNRLVRATHPFTLEDEQNFHLRLKTIFSREWCVRDHATTIDADRTPIFIVGMPRSGTTLVEQILAAHSLVHGAGELTELDRLISLTVNRAGLPYPDGIADLGPDELDKLGKAYLTALRRIAPDSGLVVDKMPHNFLWIGLIRRVLPGATIIHCRRDPMDTCWSIYKNIFQPPHGYAQDLVELGRYYRLYQDLMDYWRNLLPGRIHEVEYEKMVREPEEETRKLLDHCGLPWEDSCLSFYRHKRKVQTSSLAQVREPIYTSSVGKWRQYARQLQPLREALENHEK